MKKIIALTLSSLLCISAVGCSSKKNNNDIVATVNGNNITVKQFESTLALYKESLEAMYGSTIWDTEVEAGVKYKDKFKDIMLDQMIDIEAVCEQARKDKLAPSEEEVDKAFEELKKNIDACALQRTAPAQVWAASGTGSALQWRLGLVSLGQTCLEGWELM